MECTHKTGCSANLTTMFERFLSLVASIANENSIFTIKKAADKKQRDERTCNFARRGDKNNYEPIFPDRWVFICDPR